MAQTATFKMKECMKFFYFPADEDDKWGCKQCGKKFTCKNGWSNLQGHLNNKHSPKWKEEYSTALKSNVNLEAYGFINKKTTDMFKWMQWIITRNRPLCDIEDPTTRSVVTMQPFSVNTLKKYMEKVAVEVELKIAAELPEKFGITFDGWSKFTYHYLGLFAVYECGPVVKVVLLGISPPENEEHLDTREHVTFLENTLHFYGKNLDNVLFFVADNCSVNKSISTTTGIPMIGCYSHKFNLAVKLYIEEDHIAADIQVVHDLMKALKTLKNSGKMRRLGMESTVIENETRWSSTYNMLARYFKLHKRIEENWDDEILGKMPTRIQYNHLEQITTMMVNLNAITKQLQKADLTMAEGRGLFQLAIEFVPIMETYLGIDADIVLDEDLENAIVKILEEKEDQLTPLELIAVERFLLPVPASSTGGSALPPEISDGLDIAERFLKKRRTDAKAPTKYVNLKIVLPTSNVVERLFSCAKLILTDLRASLSPKNFEMLIFLKVNMEFWNIQTVHKAMNSPSEGLAAREHE